MSLVGLRRHDMHPMKTHMDEDDPEHMEEDDYIQKFIELYPFAAVDFEKPESFINDSTDGEFVVNDNLDYHKFAEPSECNPCAGMQERIEQLEYLYDLEKNGYGDPD